MNNEKPSVIGITVVTLVLLGSFIFLVDRLISNISGSDLSKDGLAKIYEPGERLHTSRNTADSEEVVTGSGLLNSGLFSQLLLEIFQGKLDGLGVIDGEAVLSFASDDAYQAFLARAGNSSIRILDRLDGFRSVRIGFDSINDLKQDMLEFPEDYENAGSNYTVTIPGLPEDRQAQVEVPFGANALAWIGATGDISTWGTGVRIAVLDTGVVDHTAFGDRQITRIDLSAETLGGSTEEGGEVAGHGTAVASIAAGSHEQAMGVAPAADIISVTITGADGESDSFTLAKGIVAAVDAGASVLNVSLGSYGDSALVRQAVDYATENNAVIVASGGNDTYADLSYPARYDNVVSVGAVDAQGQQLTFSNSGANLNLTAPGLEVNAAWPDENLVTFSGTSASAPFVAGALAAVMSQTPGMTASQAAEILQGYSNEAGAPGQDPSFGTGILDVGRSMTRNDNGIVDVAVASHHYDPNAPDAGPIPNMQFVVENRGTEVIYNAQLNVAGTGGDNRSYIINNLAPGDIAVREYPVNTSFGENQGVLEFQSSVKITGSGTDSNLDNNSRSTALSFIEPATETVANADSDLIEQ